MTTLKSEISLFKYGRLNNVCIQLLLWAHHHQKKQKKVRFGHGVRFG